MQMEIRENGVELQGYINVSERASKPLTDSQGQFIEVVREGVMARAIQKREVKMLFNHNWDREIGSTKSNVELQEDSIGLRFRAFITDSEVIEKAKRGLLKGCSFGFRALKQSKENINGVCKRYLDDIDLFEVSILDREPAYGGCLAEIRCLDNETLEIREIELTMEQLVEAEAIEEVAESESEKLEDKVELDMAEEVIANPDASEAEKIDAQEEIVEQAIDRIQEYKTYLWLMKTKYKN